MSGDIHVTKAFVSLLLTLNARLKAKGSVKMVRLFSFAVNCHSLSLCTSAAGEAVSGRAL